MRLTDDLTLEMLALEGLETRRREMALERSGTNHARADGWVWTLVRAIWNRQARGGDDRVNARQR